MTCRVEIQLMERGKGRVGVEVLTLGEQGGKMGVTEISEGVERQGDKRKKEG